MKMKVFMNMQKICLVLITYTKIFDFCQSYMWSQFVLTLFVLYQYFYSSLLVYSTSSSQFRWPAGPFIISLCTFDIQHSKLIMHYFDFMYLIKFVPIWLKNSSVLQCWLSAWRGRHSCRSDWETHQSSSASRPTWECNTYNCLPQANI